MTILEFYNFLIYHGILDHFKNDIEDCYKGDNRINLNIEFYLNTGSSPIIWMVKDFDKCDVDWNFYDGLLKKEIVGEVKV